MYNPPNARAAMARHSNSAMSPTRFRIGTCLTNICKLCMLHGDNSNHSSNATSYIHGPQSPHLDHHPHRLPISSHAKTFDRPTHRRLDGNSAPMKILQTAFGKSCGSPDCPEEWVPQNYMPPGLALPQHQQGKKWGQRIRGTGRRSLAQQRRSLIGSIDHSLLTVSMFTQPFHTTSSTQPPSLGTLTSLTTTMTASP